MKRVLFVLVATSVAAAAFADSAGKAGLWEMRVVRTTVDGKESSPAGGPPGGSSGAMNAKMAEQMAKMSPEMRERMQAMMGQQGAAIGANGGLRMCMSQEMAKKDVPVVDSNGSCQATNVQRSGNHMTYDIACSANGTTTMGKGEWTINGDVVTVKGDITTREHGTTHRVQSETEMRFISKDCGGVKPMAPGARN